MAHKNVKCSMCGKTVKMQHKFFYSSLTNYMVTTGKELNLVYKCRICKCSINRTCKIPINKQPKYLKVLNELRQLAKEFYSRNTNDPMVLNNFRQNVEGLFSRENIGLNNYKVLVADNIITGFKILNLPIVGSIIFPLKEEKIYE